MSKALILGDVKQELAATRRILERVPEEHFAWKPHEKSMSLGELATHIVNITEWLPIILKEPVFDLAAAPIRREPLASRSAMLEVLDASARETEKLLDECDEQALEAEWTLRFGGNVMRTQPRALGFRTFALSHLIHHRAQLGVYLRLLNVPLPGLYGPSADDAGNSN